MNAFIIFDLNNPAEQPLVVQELARVGYTQSWSANGRNHFLPLNCVWKPNTELNSAYQDLANVVTRINAARTIGVMAPIRIERCVVLSANPWVAI